MPGSRSIQRLLERHRTSLEAALSDTPLVDRLLAAGAVDSAEAADIANDVDAFITLFAAKGFAAFREMCVALELESPKLLTSLLIDTADVSGIGHSRQNSAVKLDNRVIEADVCDRNGLDRPPASTEGLADLLQEPVIEKNGNVSWEQHVVVLRRVSGYGLGVAVSGGRDNPHFASGDTSIAISDVIREGPADGKVQVNDRVVSANGSSLENVDYTTAVKILRDCGENVTLVIRRRIVVENQDAVNGNYHYSNQVINGFNSNDLQRVSISRARRKEALGVVLGCQLFVRRVVELSAADRHGGLTEGDVVVAINGTDVSSLSLKDANRLLDSARDRVDLIVARKQLGANGMGMAGVQYSLNGGTAQNGNDNDNANVISQPIQQAQENAPSAAQSEFPQDIPMMNGHLHLAENEEADVHYDSGLDENHNFPVRTIAFRKQQGSVGVRLAGGNACGIFVSAVQPGSAADAQGLATGDRILEVNGRSMRGLTREEAVAALVAIRNDQDVHIRARLCVAQYEKIMATAVGDSFYVKANFDHDADPATRELSFRNGDIFHVVDTLHEGLVGSWQVIKMGPYGASDRGVIPNLARADDLAAEQLMKQAAAATTDDMGEKADSSRGNYFRRKRDKMAIRRSKSLVGKKDFEGLDTLLREKLKLPVDAKSFYGSLKLRRKTTEIKGVFDVDLASSASGGMASASLPTSGVRRFHAYDRVVLRASPSPRPVLVFGPVADVARKKLAAEVMHIFAEPLCDSGARSGRRSVVRLSSVQDVMAGGRHPLLDVSPEAVQAIYDKGMHPIVVLTRANDKQIIKECRAGPYTSSRISTRKLLDQCQKLERSWPHVFTATLDLRPGSWFHDLVNLVQKKQQEKIFLPAEQLQQPPAQSFVEDFLVPSNPRASHYESCPDSDVEYDTTDNVLAAAAASSAPAEADVSMNGSSAQEQQKLKQMLREQLQQQLQSPHRPPPRQEREEPEPERRPLPEDQWRQQQQQHLHREHQQRLQQKQQQRIKRQQIQQHHQEQEHHNGQQQSPQMNSQQQQIMQQQRQMQQGHSNNSPRLNHYVGGRHSPPDDFPPPPPSLPPPEDDEDESAVILPRSVNESTVISPRSMRLIQPPPPIDRLTKPQMRYIDEPEAAAEAFNGDAAPEAVNGGHVSPFSSLYKNVVDESATTTFEDVLHHSNNSGLPARPRVRSGQEHRTKVQHPMPSPIELKHRYMQHRPLPPPPPAPSTAPPLPSQGTPTSPPLSSPLSKPVPPPKPKSYPRTTVHGYRPSPESAARSSYTQPGLLYSNGFYGQEQ